MNLSRQISKALNLTGLEPLINASLLRLLFLYGGLLLALPN